MLRQKASFLLACSVALSSVPSLASASVDDMDVELSITITLPDKVELGQTIKPTIMWGDTGRQDLYFQWYTIATNGVYSLYSTDDEITVKDKEFLNSHLVCVAVSADGQHVESNASVLVNKIEKVAQQVESTENKSSEDEDDSTTLDIKSTVDLVEYNGISTQSPRELNSSSSNKSRTVKQITDDITHLLDNMTVTNNISDRYVNSVLHYYLLNNDLDATVSITSKVVATQSKEGLVEGKVTLLDSLGVSTSIPFKRVIPVLSVPSNNKSKDAPELSKVANNIASKNVSNSGVFVGALGLASIKRRRRKPSLVGNDGICKEDTVLKEKERLDSFLSSYEASNDTSVVVLFKTCKKELEGTEVVLKSTKFSRKQATELEEGKIVCSFDLLDSDGNVIDSIVDKELIIPKLTESVETICNILDGYFNSDKFRPANGINEVAVEELARKQITNQDVVIKANNFFCKNSTPLSLGTVTCDISVEGNGIRGVVDVNHTIDYLPMTIDIAEEAINKALKNASIYTDESLSSIVKASVPSDTATLDVVDIKKYEPSESSTGVYVLTVNIGVGTDVVTKDFSVEIPKLKLTVGLLKSKIERALAYIVVPSSITKEEVISILPKGISIGVSIEDFAIEGGQCTCSIVLKDGEEEDMILLASPVIDLEPDVAKGVLTLQNILCDKSFDNDTDLDSIVDLVDCKLPDSISISKVIKEFKKSTFTEEGNLVVDFKIVGEVNTAEYTLRRTLPLVVEDIEDSKSSILKSLNDIDLPFTVSADCILKSIEAFYTNPTVNIGVENLDCTPASYTKDGLVKCNLIISNNRGYKTNAEFEKSIPMLDTTHDSSIISVLNQVSKIVEKECTNLTTSSELVDLVLRNMPYDYPYSLDLGEATFNRAQEATVYSNGRLSIHAVVNTLSGNSPIVDDLVFTIDKLPKTLSTLAKGVDDYFSINKSVEEGKALYSIKTAQELQGKLMEFLGVSANDTIRIKVTDFSATEPSIYEAGSLITAVSIIGDECEERVISLDFKRLELSNEDIFSMLVKVSLADISKGITGDDLFSRIITASAIPNDKKDICSYTDFKKSNETKQVELLMHIDNLSKRLVYTITDDSIRFSDLKDSFNDLRGILEETLLKTDELSAEAVAKSLIVRYLNNNSLNVKLFNFYYQASTFDIEGSINFNVEISSDEGVFQQSVSIVIPKLDLTVEESVRRARHDVAGYMSTIDIVDLTLKDVKESIKSIVSKYSLLTVNTDDLTEVEATAYKYGYISGNYVLSDANDVSKSYSVGIGTQTAMSVKKRLSLLKAELESRLNCITQGVSDQTEFNDIVNSEDFSILSKDTSLLEVEPARVSHAGRIHGFIKLTLNCMEGAEESEPIAIDIPIFRTYEHVEACVEDGLEEIKTSEDYNNLVKNAGLFSNVKVESNVDIVEPTVENDGRIQGSIEISFEQQNRIFDIDLPLQRSIGQIKEFADLRLNKATSIASYNSLVSELQEIPYLTVLNKVGVTEAEVDSNGSIVGKLVLKIDDDSESLDIFIKLYRTIEQVVKYIESKLEVIPTLDKVEQYFDRLLYDLEQDTVGDPNGIKVESHITKTQPQDNTSVGSILGVINITDNNDRSFSVNVGIPLVPIMHKLKDVVEKSLKKAENIDNVYEIYNKLKESNEDITFTISLDEVYTESGDKGYIVGAITADKDGSVVNIPVLVNMVLPTKLQQEG